MRGGWALPAPFESLGEIAARVIKDVLLEHDGPQMAIFADKHDEFLGLAMDQDSNAVRWIQVPLSHLERDALLSGAQPIRDALLKSTALIVDYAHDGETPLFAWRTNWEGIPESILPKKGVVFPGAWRKVKAFKKRKRRSPRSGS